MVQFIEYPPCSTCQKAKKWLTEHEVSFTSRHIKEQNPSAQELAAWQKKSGLPLKRFFNTSGILYRQLNLKDKLASMSEEEQLVKRPLVIGDTFVLVGFREKEWLSLLFSK